MSMKRLAVLSALHTAQFLPNNSTASVKDLHTGYNNMSGSNSGTGRSGRYETDLHGNVNILLGGAMLGGVIMVVFLVCYCCHRNMRKNRPHEYSHYWRPEPDVHSLEVFTMDSHAMCYERNPGAIIQPDEITSTTALPSRPLTPGPPPAYESLNFRPCQIASPSDKKPDYTIVSCILPVPLEIQNRTVVHQQQRILKEEESRTDDEGLPSYEAALKLEAYGYV